MTYDKFRYQKMIKSKNEESILLMLKESPKRFKELKEKTGLSQMGLTNILKKLTKDNKLKKIIDKDEDKYHEAYTLTKKGQDYLKGMWMILNEIYDLESKKAGYNSSYFSFLDVNWSTIIEKDSTFIDYDDFTDDVTKQYTELVFKHIKKNYIKKNNNGKYYLDNADKIHGKHIIAFEVDLDSIKKNIEDFIKNAEDRKKKYDSTKGTISIITANLIDRDNEYKELLYDE